MGQVAGLPVDYRYYDSAEGQRAALAEVLKRLLADGIKPSDIVVVSPLRLGNSGVAGVDGGTDFRIMDVGEPPPARSRIPLIRFATTQAFKGMESTVVVLCDVDQIGTGEPQCILYVGMSRARSQLTVLVHESAKSSIMECIRRKLEEGWNKNP
jgi:hypothetical protein